MEARFMDPRRQRVIASETKEVSHRKLTRLCLFANRDKSLDCSFYLSYAVNILCENVFEHRVLHLVIEIPLSDTALLRESMAFTISTGFSS